MSVLPESVRSSTAFRSRYEAKRYWITLTVMSILAVLFTLGLLVYKNPVSFTSPSFLPVVSRRLTAVIAMTIAALCQSMGTLTFQTITSNRIITPSLLGFESLYSAINTAIVFFFGARTLTSLEGLPMFLVQIGLMMVLAALLYGTLLKDTQKDMQFVLLIGIIIGSDLRSLSSFMRKVLAPSEFDILQAKLFGSVNNADPSYFWIAIPLVLTALFLLVRSSRKLNVTALGGDVSAILGLDHRRQMIFYLLIISVLMAVSTALVGSLTFFGFLVVSFTYRLAPTYDHRFLFPMAMVFGFLVISSSYFLMYHVFNAQGVVSIIMELCGGSIFLFMLLRKGE
jgi:iron complex transport system permease protein